MQPSYSIPSHHGNGFSTRFWRVSILYGLPTVLSPYTSPLASLFGIVVAMLLNPSRFDLKVFITESFTHLGALGLFWWPLISLILLLLGFFWDHQMNKGQMSRSPIKPQILYTVAIVMNWLPFIGGIIMFFAAVFSKDGFVL